MQETIDFDIKLPLDIGRKLQHIKNKSCYNHNYYLLPTYGDWIWYGDHNNNVLYQVCHEDENCYTYSLGRFENNKFVKVLSWLTGNDILDGISTENIDIEPIK